MLQERLKSMQESERIQFLANNAGKMEPNQIYRRDLTDEEIMEAEKEFTKQSIKLDQKVEEFNLIRDEFKEETKSVKQDLKINIRKVRNGFEEKIGTLYLFDDQETGLMESYDVDGNLISVRKLLPSEKQKTIFSIAK